MRGQGLPMAQTPPLWKVRQGLLPFLYPGPICPRHLCSFPVAPVTNDHTLSGLKQQHCLMVLGIRSLKQPLG